MALKFPDGFEASIHKESTGRPFKKCPVCNLQQVPSSHKACYECERLLAMKVAVPKDPGSGVQDCDPATSNPSGNHSGYSDTISSAKFDPKRGRV